MKINSKTMFVALLGASLAASLFACGGKTSTSTFSVVKDTYDGTLTVSGPTAQSNWLKAELDKCNTYRTANGMKALTFKTAVYEESEVDSKITDWTTGPDVFAFASDKIQPLNAAGALATVTGNNKTFISSTMGDTALSAATLAGKVLGYPYDGGNGYFLFYNKSFFTGANADKYKTIEGIEEVAAANNMKFAYPLKTAFFGAGELFTFGAKYTVNIADDGSISSVDADFDQANGIKGGKAMYNMMKNSTWQNTESAPTAENKLVACITGAWNVADSTDSTTGVVTKGYRSLMGDGYACAKMPTITLDGETKTLGSFLGYKVYGVNPQVSAGNAQRTLAAHQVAQFLSGETVQKERFDTFGSVPTNTAVKNDSTVKSTPHVMALADQSTYATAQTAVPSNIWKAPATLATDIDTGTTTLDNMAAAMKTLNDAVKASK